MPRITVPIAIGALALTLSSTGCERPAATETAADGRGAVLAATTAPLAAIESRVAGAAGSASEANVAVAASAEPVYRGLRDMVVACDNTRHCEVIGVRDGPFALVLTLRRDAGPAGRQQLVLAAADERVRPAALRLDDAPSAALSALPWRQDKDDEGALHLDDPVAIARFIDLVRDASALTIAGGEVGASLSGFTAALLLVDEQQQRLDTRGAWMRRGDRDNTTVAPAPALPTLPAAPSAPPPLSADDAARLTRSVRAAQAAALQEEDCNVPGEGFDVSELDDAEPFDASDALVFIACLSGAYQSSSLVFRAARDGSGQATRIILPPLAFAIGDQPPQPFAMLTNASYDPETATLGTFAKGRGLADCGLSASWRYDGRELRLSSYAELDRCGGGQPGDWPTLWRTARDSAGAPGE